MLINNDAKPYVHKAVYSDQNRPREGELGLNGMKVARSQFCRFLGRKRSSGTVPL